ncbi:MAG: ribosomal-processing cysteine protease Prp [Spirochaetales bacterium]|nr:ribosomal-processing cysteine protease Prp [Leptospiraceae bacterium]MCP5483537.1 ribosomal-processing cysteine protease Prp [Spirochaetales bacterium]MCP5486892.1 ribosomal-processing cysteine protease Prp [Spirochaetales bacterium]
MIRLAVRTESDDRVSRIELSGHAGTAAHGNDIVCAAVSVLVENLGAGLKELLQLPVQIKADKGYYRLDITKEADSHEARVLIASALFGLQVVARQNPGRLEIISE